MNILKAEYISSHVKLDQCPQADRPEYAFIGRSNVGKSSLINMLCQRKALAHTSSTPGKTQTINYFNIDDDWYLVDLPGYGYAKTPKRLRRQWKVMIEDYMLNRPNLLCAFILIDSCVPPQKQDVEFANWMGENGVPFVFVFTKNDRKKSHKNKNSVEDFEKEMLQYWNTMPQHYVTSSKDGTGREDVLALIEQVNEQYWEEEND